MYFRGQSVKYGCYFIEEESYEEGKEGLTVMQT
jgi:hypothetical protein